MQIDLLENERKKLLQTISSFGLQMKEKEELFSYYDKTIYIDKLKLGTNSKLGDIMNKLMDYGDRNLVEDVQDCISEIEAQRDNL